MIYYLVQCDHGGSEPPEAILVTISRSLAEETVKRGQACAKELAEIDQAYNEKYPQNPSRIFLNTKDWQARQRQWSEHCKERWKVCKRHGFDTLIDRRDTFDWEEFEAPAEEGPFWDEVERAGVNHGS